MKKTNWILLFLAVLMVACGTSRVVPVTGRKQPARRMCLTHPPRPSEKRSMPLATRDRIAHETVPSAISSIVRHRTKIRNPFGLRRMM